MRWNVVFDPGLNELDKPVLRSLIEIEAYKKSVLKLPLPPRMRREIDQLNIVRQIKGTTGIEGNTLSEREIGQIISSAEAGPRGAKREARPLEQQEVLNAHRVLEFIRQDVQKNPDGLLTEERIRHLHFLTTEGCDYPANVPGAYRTFQNVAGEYTPPEPEQVPRLMAEFVEFINSRRVIERYGPVIRAILAHFYLVSIHPFGDGNGRTSRGAEAYILYCGGYNVRGFYSLANFYYKNRYRYVEELQAARFRHQGRLTEFVRFSLDGFVSELEQIQEQILDFVRRVMFMDYVEELSNDQLISWRALTILKYMVRERQRIRLQEFKSKEHYVVEAVYRTYRGVKTLSRDLKQLLDQGLLEIRDGFLEPNMGLMGKFQE